MGKRAKEAKRIEAALAALAEEARTRLGGDYERIVGELTAAPDAGEPELVRLDMSRGFVEGNVAIVSRAAARLLGRYEGEPAQ